MNETLMTFGNVGSTLDWYQINATGPAAAAARDADLPPFSRGILTSPVCLPLKGEAFVMQVQVQNDVVQFPDAAGDIICT